MTPSEISTMLQSISTNLPVYYDHAPVGAKIPYIDWRYSSSNNFSADNKTYCEVYEVSVEFYSGEKDITTEGLIKSVLKDNDIPFAHGEVYLDDERVYIETYNFSVIDQ